MEYFPLNGDVNLRSTFSSSRSGPGLEGGGGGRRGGEYWWGGRIGGGKRSGEKRGIRVGGEEAYIQFIQ